MNVGGSQTKFTFPFFDKEPIGKFSHELLYNGGRSIRGVILYDKHIQLFWQ
jgi:hypothetical protein